MLSKALQIGTAHPLLRGPSEPRAPLPLPAPRLPQRVIRCSGHLQAQCPCLSSHAPGAGRAMRAGCASKGGGGGGGGGGAGSALTAPGAQHLLRPTAAAILAAATLLACALPAEALTLQEAVGGLEGVIADAGALGPLIFVAAYVAFTVLLIPGSVLTLAAGFLFGPALGTAVVSVASTAGASAAFLVGRYLARPAVQARISANPRFAAVDRAIAAQGPWIVFLLRLSPLFPFSLLNYALSLSSVEFVPYVLASWAGMLPGTVAFVALGGAGKAAAESAAAGGADPVRLGLYAVGAAATLAVTSVISKAASRALEEAEQAAAADKE